MTLSIMVNLLKLFITSRVTQRCLGVKGNLRNRCVEKLEECDASYTHTRLLRLSNNNQNKLNSGRLLDE